jgi:hypothetical protein
MSHSDYEPELRLHCPDCGKYLESHPFEMGDRADSGFDLCGCEADPEVKQRAIHAARERRWRRANPEKMTWRAMLSRCQNPTNISYPYYGGRGIKVSQAWAESFDAFMHDMGPRPSPKHSIDRIDVNGDYEPSNCRWATRAEQARGHRRNRMLTAFGRTQCLEDWATEFGLNVVTLHSRLRGKRLSVEEALTRPLKPTRPRRSAAE